LGKLLQLVLNGSQLGTGITLRNARRCLTFAEPCHSSLECRLPMRIERVGIHTSASGVRGCGTLITGGNGSRSRAVRSHKFHITRSGRCTPTECAFISDALETPWAKVHFLHNVRKSRQKREIKRPGDSETHVVVPGEGQFASTGRRMYVTRMGVPGRSYIFRPIRRNSIRRKIYGMKFARKSLRTTPSNL
jgi:hypothetical protein